MSNFGYSGAILKVDLTQRKTATSPTSDYADRFIGGRGMAAKLYWDLVPPHTRAFDPENCFICATGPLAGFKRLAGSRWQICGKSAAMDPQKFSYANVGGSFGAWLKFAGYDALAVQGSSDVPVYLSIQNGITEIKDASHLAGKTTYEKHGILQKELGKHVRILATGPAGENLVSLATVLASQDASGSGGFGNIMGAKKIMAIAVAGKQKPVAAKPERLAELAKRMHLLRGPRHWPAKHKWTFEGKSRQQICYGCIGGCIRQAYRTESGRRIKFFCQMADMYETAALKYYGDWNEVVVYAADLCQKYGLDTFVLEPMIAWLDKCYTEGILREEETGLPLSKIGSPEFIETLVRKISFKEDFGQVLAEGTLKAAEEVGNGSQAFLGDSIGSKSSDMATYDPRLYPTHGILYATDPRKPVQQLHETSFTITMWEETSKFGPQKGVVPKELLVTRKDFMSIAEKFWGSRIGGDMSTYEGKALAAKKIQDRSYAKESLVLCDFNYPVIFLIDPKDHIGDASIESNIYTAITGRETDEEALNRMGEAIFNLQRAIHIRDGWAGRDGDLLMDAFHEIPLESVRFNDNCIVPGKNGEPFSRRGLIMERESFEKMKSEYYELRGWDAASGLQTRDRLQELGLSDIANELEAIGCLKQKRSDNDVQ